MALCMMETGKRTNAMDMALIVYQKGTARTTKYIQEAGKMTKDM